MFTVIVPALNEVTKAILSLVRPRQFMRLTNKNTHVHIHTQTHPGASSFLPSRWHKVRALKRVAFGWQKISYIVELTCSKTECICGARTLLIQPVYHVVLVYYLFIVVADWMQLTTLNSGHHISAKHSMRTVSQAPHYLHSDVLYSRFRSILPACKGDKPEVLLFLTPQNCRRGDPKCNRHCVSLFILPH